MLVVLFDLASNVLDRSGDARFTLLGLSGFLSPRKFVITGCFVGRGRDQLAELRQHLNVWWFDEVRVEICGDEEVPIGAPAPAPG